MNNIITILHTPISNLCWIFSKEACNFGGFLSGICAFILLVLAIISFFYGPHFIERWKREKRAEKLSNIAEETLNHLDQFKNRIDIWIKFASNHSTEKKQLACKVDSEDNLNYYKEAHYIINELHMVKYKILRLSNPKLENSVKEFEGFIEPQLMRLLNNAFSADTEKSFTEAAEKSEAFYTMFHNQLLKIFNFQNKL